MQCIVCLLFVKLVLVVGTAEVVDAASSQFTSQRITRGMLPTQTFGSQIDTEYDEVISKEEKREVSEVDSDGLTLGITVGTQPMRLRRFGTQKIVMSEQPLKSFGSQVATLSEVPSEERLADGLQRWGSQVSEPSEVPMEPLYGKLRQWGSQGPEESQLPPEPLAMHQIARETKSITMSEAMVPHSEAAIEKPKESSIVLHEAPLRHTWSNDIIVSEQPLKHFGRGAASTDPLPNPEWHLAWEASVVDAPHAANPGRPGRLKSGAAQQQIAAEPHDDQAEPSFEHLLNLWREAFFVMGVALLAIQMCISQRTQAKPLLRA
eukprot:gnl/MRDRNA2_/MRDRNA2_89504_c0_seq1.p1 gnl/MRDRNA2_/MRDRNA2_89504_c0~~gnl/MRDRNA2_/MRDRNA2_89504_c0_seq1.p1  ORF type:complete len:320 (+),score=69.45 gnl/MRDRNA2_/MRDRNA2_89504_c0_seq1:89-1048(+)